MPIPTARRAAGALAVLLLLAAIVFFLSYHMLSASGSRLHAPPEVYEVVVDGQAVANVESLEDFETALQTLTEEEVLANVAPMTVANSVTTRKVRPDAEVLTLEGDALVDVLNRSVRFDAQAVVLIVDGVPAVVLRSEHEARQVLERLLADYRTRLERGEFRAPGRNRIEEQVALDSIEIAEQVRFEPVAAQPGEIVDAERAVAVLLRGTDRILVHKVRAGESMWTVAHTNAMTVADLEQANPEVADPERLQVGQELNLIVPDPYVTVHSVEERRYRKAVPFATQVEYDDELWPWEEYIKQPGVQGQREVVERVERVNGEITDVRVLSDETVSQPRVQIVVRGNKVVPDMGTGLLRWPLNQGQVTDGFGYSGWRRRHHDGVDIAAPRGTPVYAAEAGVVTTTGWRGGYGQTVMIDHGGGKRVTLYAHLSSISVAVGQKLKKGAEIGRVGSTGFSTGPHLHFEIHIDGRIVDPIGYFEKQGG